jgi:hypothetical protein
VRIIGVALAVLLALALEDEAASRAREAFLADTADAAALRGLAAFPELLDDRQVRQKFLRSFSSSDRSIAVAAFELAMKTPGFAVDPAVTRRLDQAISVPDVPKKAALLDMAVQQGHLADMRIVTLIAESLSDPAPTLRERALQIVRDEKELQRRPAIAEALARQPAPFERPAVTLPAWESFKENVHPILERPGSDDKACFDCHRTHAVLKLPEIDDASPAEEQIKARYRAALRVIDLEDPEKSLLLSKPISPYLPKGGAARGTPTHGGGVRFEKGSREYETILDWIKTGRR